MNLLRFVRTKVVTGRDYLAHLAGHVGNEKVRSRVLEHWILENSGEVGKSPPLGPVSSHGDCARKNKGIPARKDSKFKAQEAAPTIADSGH